VSKEINDLSVRLRGLLLTLDGELSKMNATEKAAAEAPPPPPPGPSVEDMQRVKQTIEEAEGLVKDLKVKLTPPEKHPESPDKPPVDSPSSHPTTPPPHAAGQVAGQQSTAPQGKK
jgi:hypothetical protein